MSGNGRFVLVGLTGAAGAGVELWDTLARKKVGEWGQAGDGVGATLVAFSPRADRAVAVFSRHAAGAAPGTTEGKPWRVQFIDTSDITAIKPGKSFDIDVELSSVQITDDRQTLGLSLGGSGLNAVRLSDTGVEPVASIGTAGLARPFYWTGDKRWVLAGSTEHRFSIYDASGNAGGTELAPAGSADMTAAWDRPRLIAASLPVDNGQRTARDVMIVTERNAILLFRLNLTASGNNNGGNGNGNGESVPGGSNE